MLSERSQNHEACWTMLWGPVRGAPGKKAEGPLPQVHAVPWIVLGCDSMPSETNICIQSIRHVHSRWSQSVAIEPNLMKGSAECRPPWALNPGLAFVHSQI